MSTINLQIVNNSHEFLMVNNGGDQFRMCPNFARYIEDFDTAKQLEIAVAEKPNTARVFKGGHFRGNIKLECSGGGDRFDIRELSM